MSLAAAPEPARIEIIEPAAERCPALALPPEGNVKLRNYRMLNENLRAYTPTGDVHTSPSKGKLVARFDAPADVSPPRARILELVRDGDPGRAALEAIVRPAPRRGLPRPLDEDARRFLQRALLSPSPAGSGPASPEPRAPAPREPSPGPPALEPSLGLDETSSGLERSLADELREAEAGEWVRPRAWRGGGAAERARLARLALAVEEEDEGADAGAGAALGAAARRLDALLAESRALHAELAAIHRDLQVESARAWQCAAGARALLAEAHALRYLDDVVALLRGDVAGAVRARAWPFAAGRRAPGRNYVV